MSDARMIRTDGVELCVERFGDVSHPTILLVHGASASMLWWPDEFCERLAAGRRHVVRFDNLDTGRSTSFPVGRPGYSLADMADDAIGILDALGVEKAHLVGRSMAGGIVTLAALLHPERVDTLTLVSITTGGADLPGMAAQVLEYTTSRRPDPADRDDVVDFIVDFGAPAQVVGRVVEAPVLILHGELDPAFPPAHAPATQRNFPGAELVILPRTGHDLPPQTWDAAIAAILRHSSGGWEEEEERISSAALAAGDPVGWFETLYQAGAAGSVEMPWSRRNAHPLLTQWAEQNHLSGAGRSAIVIGCGLGADAEYIAGLGYETTAFDVSETAVRVARERFPGTAVHYTTADLLALPAQWSRAFDLVVEVITVQALPPSLRSQAIAAVRDLVAAGGTLFVVSAIHDAAEPAPPWPLTRAEVESFADGGLQMVALEAVAVPGKPEDVRWRAEFRRPPVA